MAKEGATENNFNVVQNASVMFFPLSTKSILGVPATT